AEHKDIESLRVWWPRRVRPIQAKAFRSHIVVLASRGLNSVLGSGIVTIGQPKPFGVQLPYRVLVPTGIDERGPIRPDSLSQLQVGTWDTVVGPLIPDGVHGQ